MLPTPNSLIFLMVVSAVCGVWLTYVMRSYCTNARNVPSPSKIFEHFACISLMIAMTAAASLQIFSRYVLAGLIPESIVDYFLFPWTEEFSRLCMVWMALIGAAMVQREDEHICMTALFDILPRSIQKFVRIFGDIVCVVIFACITWLGWETARGLDIMFTIEMGFPLSVFAYPVPIGGALLTIHSVRLTVSRILNT